MGMQAIRAPAFPASAGGAVLVGSAWITTEWAAPERMRNGTTVSDRATPPCLTVKSSHTSFAGVAGPATTCL